jgi:hypothetical protein
LGLGFRVQGWSVDLGLPLFPAPLNPSLNPCLNPFHPSGANSMN